MLTAIFESLRMALDAVWAHKLRAALTLLGVIVGVATIIASMTVIAGVRSIIDDQMKNALSANVFQVQRYELTIFGPHDRERERRPKLEAELADAIRARCPSVRAVGVEAWADYGGLMARLGGLKSDPTIQLAGGTPEFALNNGLYVDRGRFLAEMDIVSARHVIVIGDDIVESLFGTIDPIGEYIRIGSDRYEVIGTFEKRGEALGESQDCFCCMPLSTFFNLYGKRSVNLTVQAWSAEIFEQAIEEVTEVMRVERGLKPGQPNNFYIWTPETLQQSFSNISRWVSVAAFGICAISLLVAGIGIMNIMLVSVTERTREIGVRKALGGKRVSILRQFVIEAIMLSEVGGAIGILVGFLAAVVINHFLKFPTPIPVWSITLSVIFCSAVGLIFGIWPAVKAARLNPIEALRYE
jgi:putative ABC transport system permease protein